MYGPLAICVKKERR